MHRRGDRLAQDRHLQKIEWPTMSEVSKRLQAMAGKSGATSLIMDRCVRRFRRYTPSLMMRWEVF
jgi:hypothetical protein